METSISNQAALRVALASRSLPNIGVKSLLGLLIQHLGEPLSEQKLRTLSPKAFRILMASFDDGLTRKEVTDALAVLTSQEVGAADAPEIPATLTPLVGPKLCIAITSNQGEELNGHYGSCLRVLVYEVNAERYQLVDVRSVDSDLRGEARSDYMLSLLHGCHVLFTLSIGGPAAAKVTRADVHPVKRPKPEPAAIVLQELCEVIAGNPPPWIAKLLGVEPAIASYSLDEEE